MNIKVRLLDHLVYEGVNWTMDSHLNVKQVVEKEGHEGEKAGRGADIHHLYVSRMGIQQVFHLLL